VVIDEAYFEFSDSTVASLIAENSNLVVLRTLSKWAGLAGMRLGYGLMDSVVAERLIAIKPPYNINIAAEIALVASLDDKQTLLARVQAIVKERGCLFQQLNMISGVVPIPSHANFILCRLPEGQGRLIQEGLAKRGVLVRHYDTPRLRDHIRVSVGLRYQNEALIEGLKDTILHGG
jgi:histidinol-phosphate aminotransferase